MNGKRKASIKESEQLGMPVGTAQHRLRKMLLFQLVQETNRDQCYRCEQTIEEAGDLSIDHKERWRGVSAALFWDLGNLTFSHRWCNTPDTTLGDRRLCKNGHPWSKDNTRWTTSADGYTYRECRACDRDRWHKNKERENRNRKIRRLHAKGDSLRQIAKKVGISHIMVRNIIRDGETGSRT